MIKLRKGYNSPQITIIDGKPVNLGGTDIKRIRPAVGVKAASETIIKGATKSQLERLYREGHPLLESVADEKTEKKGKSSIVEDLPLSDEIELEQEDVSNT